MASTEGQIRRTTLALAAHPAAAPRILGAEPALLLSAAGALVWANPAAGLAFGPDLAGAEGLVAALRRAPADGPAVVRLRVASAQSPVFVCRLERLDLRGESALLATVLAPRLATGDEPARLAALARTLAGDGYAAILDADGEALAAAGQRPAGELTEIPVAGTGRRLAVTAAAADEPITPPDRPAAAPTALAPEPSPLGSKRSERQEYARAFESGSISDRPDDSIRSESALASPEPAAPSVAPAPPPERTGTAPSAEPPTAAADEAGLPGGSPGLSRPEWEAFRLVAAALGARFEGDAADGAPDAGAVPAPEAGSPPEAVASEPAPVPAPAERHRRLGVPAAANDAGLLDRIPVALLVCRGDRLLHANHAALTLLGYRTTADLAAAGGLASLFAEPAPADSRPVRIRRADGATEAVDARITSIPWNGGTALLVALTAAAPGARAEPVPPAEALLDGVADAVLVLGPGGAVVAANRASERLFGTPRDALVGRGFAALAAPESRLAVAAAVQAAAAGEGDRTGTVTLLAAGGVREATMSLGRAGDTRLCVVLRPAGPAAEAAPEPGLADRSALVAHLSHEIRTPINAIVGFAEVMLEERLGPLGEPRYRDYLRDVRASGLHVLGLVDDLLDLARVEAGHADLELRPLVLNEVVRETVSMMQATAARGRVVLRLALADGLPPVTADRRSLRQILLNLLSNAVKFNVAGGQVIVSTARDDDGAVALRVRDTGIGMTETEAVLALEPFRRVHGARYGGTGLGLPLSKALAEANGGRLTIRSQPRRGTLVEITLPAAAAAAHRREAVP